MLWIREKNVKIIAKVIFVVFFWPNITCRSTEDWTLGLRKKWILCVQCLAANDVSLETGTLTEQMLYSKYTLNMLKLSEYSFLLVVDNVVVMQCTWIKLQIRFNKCTLWMEC